MLRAMWRRFKNLGTLVFVATLIAGLTAINVPSAAATGVSTPSVSLSSYAASASSVQYTVSFTTTTAIPAGGEIIIRDVGSIFPTSPSDYTVNGTTVTAAAAPYYSADIHLTLAASVAASTLVQVVANGVTNPSSGGDQIDVYTSTDTDLVPSAPFTIGSGGPTGVTNLSLHPSSTTGNADSNDTVVFNTSATGELTAAASTITVQPGWLVTLTSTASAYSIDGEAPLSVTSQTSGGVQLTVPQNIAASSSVTLIANGVANPATGSLGFYVSTSSDVAPMLTPPIDIAGGSGGGTPTYWPSCSSAAATNCVASFTLNGQSAPASLTLNAFVMDGVLDFQVQYAGQYDLLAQGSPVTSTADTIGMTLNIGSLDPTIVIDTGMITSESLSGPTSGELLTLTTHPEASSWATSCPPDSSGLPQCPTTAQFDYAGLDIGAAEAPVSPSGLTGAAETAYQSFASAMAGMYISTNAQAFGTPEYDPTTGGLNVLVAAPHFKTDGTTLNTGFFSAYIPSMLLQLWGLTTTQSLAQLTATGANGTLSVVPDGSGATLTLSGYHYSSPTFSIGAVPAAPSSMSVISGSNSLAVRWSTPSKTGSSAISKYVITATPISGGSPIATSVAAPATSTTLSGLGAGTTYDVTVAAENGIGTGPDSAAAVATTDEPTTSTTSTRPTTPTLPTTPIIPTPPPPPAPTAPLPPLPPLPPSVPPASFGTPAQTTVSAGHTAALVLERGGASASVDVPSGALPAGTTLSVAPVVNATALRSVVPAGGIYVTSFSVSWETPSGTSPEAAAPITMTISDPAIRTGDIVYELTAKGLIPVGRATTNGSANVSFTNDPVFLVAAPPRAALARPVAQATVSAVPVRISCTAGAPCTGRALLSVVRRHDRQVVHLVLARAAFRVTAGRVQTVNLRLTTAGRRLLLNHRGPRLGVSLLLKVRDGNRLVHRLIIEGR